MTPLPERDSGIADYRWGNALYVDFSLGDAYVFLEKRIVLIAMAHDSSTVRVGEKEVVLRVARRALPVVIDGVRLFLADNRNVKELTSDPAFHGLTRKDALLCLSDASRPLLDAEQYTFPISRRDGYHWHMEERSQMFTYYGDAPYMKHVGLGVGASPYYRSHEGIDFNMHDARGIEKHPLVAIEAGRVELLVQTNEDEVCAIIGSDSNPQIYYVYQHLCVRHCYVSAGQSVKRGEKLGCIWGDGVWGHLHFSVVHRDGIPGYADRYNNLLNAFPQMYELWHGDLAPRPRIWTRGHLTFGHEKSAVENKLSTAVFDDIVGYGWRIEDWCAAASVDAYPERTGSLPLGKVLHEGTRAAAENPNDHLDFEVTVAPGNHAVRVRVGDVFQNTWQRVACCGVDLGTFTLEAGNLQWTKEARVRVPDGRLTVRIGLKDRNTRAGISELIFALEQA